MKWSSMNITVKELDAFSVIGQRIELANTQKKNIQISTQFWRVFNSNLKKAYLIQHGNWTKYAFMEKREGKLFYYCAIPKKIVVPDGFVEKKIDAHQYLVVEHVGSMDRIYDTYKEIYQNLLPSTKLTPSQENFMHFERYSERFNWNREDSVIEIWLPVKSGSK